MSTLAKADIIILGLQVYGSIGDAEGRQSHFYRLNLYCRLEAFRETAT